MYRESDLVRISRVHMEYKRELLVKHGKNMLLLHTLRRNKKSLHSTLF